ncbi:DUF2256 domain-containing protein [Gemmata sp.]|uniref:DUF2256 domain-containing protein n=1 Tax=Gemmata sp. TaxID=1914242 RepID=UPI003F6F269A
MPRTKPRSDLPEKTCAACRRPFVWRKKWARDWDRVRFCSERCRRARTGPAGPSPPGGGP